MPSSCLPGEDHQGRPSQKTTIGRWIDERDTRTIELNDRKDELDQRQRNLNQQTKTLQDWETHLLAQSDALKLRLAQSSQSSTVRKPVLSLARIQTIVSIQPVDGDALLTGHLTDRSGSTDRQAGQPADRRTCKKCYTTLPSRNTLFLHIYSNTCQPPDRLDNGPAPTTTRAVDNRPITSPPGHKDMATSLRCGHMGSGPSRTDKPTEVTWPCQGQSVTRLGSAVGCLSALGPGKSTMRREVRPTGWDVTVMGWHVVAVGWHCARPLSNRGIRNRAWHELRHVEFWVCDLLSPDKDGFCSLARCDTTAPVLGSPRLRE
ncbi:hypothetical protein B0T24DRAFT_604902 [Lasiosphaeria ovina]|uniref:Uncharacterized protein n=1 Tax=Lasiosphaeria ovina TaxID=92902 RepID=A0AAE0NKY0_9PEZI|nr:hypothetical protein B0T24DRAFT_604902 [Lasiosphaeria ovina]